MILFFSNACKKQEIGNDDSRFGTKIMILGHMGMGIAFSWPGNSKESIKTCLEIGCDGSEMDIQMTLDSVLVAYHDKDLSSRTNCNGKIHEMNWKDLENCIYNRSINSAGIASVDEIFASIPNVHDYYFSFDCKTDVNVTDQMQFFRKYLRAIARISEKYDLENHIFIEGSKEFLSIAKDLGLKNPLFLFSNFDDQPADTAANRGFFGVSIPSETAAKDLEYCNGLKIRTMLWAPFNYFENKELLNKKPDIIQTDDPISILKLTNRFNYETVRP